MPRSRKPNRTPGWQQPRKPSTPLLTLGLTAILMSCLSGCALNGFGAGPLVVSDTCRTFSATVTATGRPALPLKYHKGDDPDTKAGAQAVNRAYRSLCPEAAK